MKFIMYLTKNKVIVTLSVFYFIFNIIVVLNMNIITTKLAIGHTIFTIFLLMKFGICFFKYHRNKDKIN